MLPMSVTLDVSQLEMSSLKEVKLLNNESMSVIAETSQLAIGPCALRAAALSLFQSWTAAFRSALVAKVPEELPPPHPQHIVIEEKSVSS